MDKQFFRKLFLLNKRFLKTPVFAFLLCFIPLCLLFIHLSPSKNTSSLNIAVYVPEDASPLTIETANNLFSSNNPKSIVTYYKYNFSEIELATAISEEIFFAGIVFPSNVENLFATFEEKNPKGKDKIKVFVKSENTISRLVREKTFATIYHNVARKMLENYIKRTDEKTFNNPKNIDLINYCYEFYKTDNTLFIVEKNSSTNNKENKTQVDFFAIFPVRGMISIFVFLIGLASSFYFIRDRKKSLLLCFSDIPSFLLRFLYIMLPVFDAGIIMLLSLRFSVSFTNWGREILLILPFLFYVGIFCSVLCTLIQDEILIASLLPILAIASLLLCPIFINIKIAPIIQMLLPPYFYLNFFL